MVSKSLEITWSSVVQPKVEKITTSNDTVDTVNIETKENLSEYKKELLTPGLPKGAFELVKNRLNIQEPIDIKVVKKSIQDYQKKHGISIDQTNPMVWLETYTEMKADIVNKKIEVAIKLWKLNDTLKKDILSLVENPGEWKSYLLFLFNLESIKTSFWNTQKDFILEIEQQSKKWAKNLQSNQKVVKAWKDFWDNVNDLVNWDITTKEFISKTKWTMMILWIIGFIFFGDKTGIPWTESIWSRLAILIWGSMLWLDKVVWNLAWKVVDWVSKSADKSDVNVEKWISELSIPQSVKEAWDKTWEAFKTWITKLKSLNDSYTSSDTKELKIDSNKLWVLTSVFTTSNDFMNVDISTLESTNDLRSLLTDAQKVKLKWITGKDLIKFKKLILAKKENGDIEIKDLFIDNSILWQASRKMKQWIDTVMEKFEVDFVENDKVNVSIKEKLNLLQVIDDNVWNNVIRNLKRYQYSNSESSLWEGYNYLRNLIVKDDNLVTNAPKKLDKKTKKVIKELRDIYYITYKIEGFKAKIKSRGIEINANDKKESLKIKFDRLIIIEADIKKSKINDIELNDLLRVNKQVLLTKLVKVDNSYQTKLDSLTLEDDKKELIKSINSLTVNSTKADYENVSKNKVFDKLEQTEKDKLYDIKSKIDGRIKKEEATEISLIKKVELYKGSKLSSKPELIKFIKEKTKETRGNSIIKDKYVKRYLNNLIKKDITVEKLESEFLQDTTILNMLDINDKKELNKIVEFIKIESEK